MKRSFLLFFIIGLVMLSSNALSITNTVLFTDFARNSAYQIVVAPALVDVNVKIYDTGSGTYIYEEDFTGVAPNEFGLFSVAVGSGTPVNPPGTTWSSVPYNSGIWVMVSVRIGMGPWVSIQSILLEKLVQMFQIPMGSIGSDQIIDGSIQSVDIADGTILPADMSFGNYSSVIGAFTNIVDISTGYSALVTDGTILSDCSAGAITVTLPAPASGNKGLRFSIKKVDLSANPLIIAPASGTIDGAPNKTTIVPWQGFIVQSNGAAWFVVGIY